MPDAMRRLLRILFNAATVLSLVLCAATLAAWARSYRARDVIWWTRGKPLVRLEVSTYRGGLFAGALTSVQHNISVPPGSTWRQSAPVTYAEGGGSEGTFFNRFGFAALDYHQHGTYVKRQFACPYWFIMLLTAILPIARLAGWRRRARRLRMHPSLCRHCGYDCRATPERCPECGTAAITPAPISA
jgi:hypothetical protein